MSAAKEPAKKAAKKTAAKKTAPKQPESRPAVLLVPGDRISLDGAAHLVEQVKVLNHIAYVHVSTQDTVTGFRSSRMINAAHSVLLAGGDAR